MSRDSGLFHLSNEDFGSRSSDEDTDNAETTMTAAQQTYQSATHVECQMTDIKVLLYCNYDPKSVSIKYIIRLSIGIICVVIASAINNLITNALFTIIWVILIIITVLECNKQIRYNAFWFTFEVYYKILNVGWALLGYFIIFDWFENQFTHNYPYKHILLYLNGAIIMFGNMCLVAVISIADGYNIYVSIKVAMTLCMIIYYLYLMIFNVYLSDCKYQLYILGDYPIYWRSTSLSSLFCLIIFLIKQLLVMVLFPNRLTIIDIYLPIRTTNDVDFSSTYEVDSSVTHTPNTYTSYATTTRSRDYENSNVNIPAATLVTQQQSQQQQQPQQTTVVTNNSNAINNNHINPNFNAVHVNTTSSPKSDRSYRNHRNQRNKRSHRHERKNRGDGGRRHHNNSYRYDHEERMLRVTSNIPRQFANYHIVISKYASFWYIVLRYLCCKRHSKSVYYSRKIISSWCLRHICMFIIAMHVMIEFIFNYQTFGNGNRRILTGYFETGFEFIYLSAIVTLTLMINYQIFLFEMQNKFSIYWRLYDLSLTYIATIVLTYHYKLYDFDTNYVQLWQAISISFLNFSGIVLIVIAICIVHGFILFPKWMQLFAILLNLMYWTTTGVTYLLMTNDIIIKPFGGRNETISLRNLIIAKIADAVVWFLWQFVEQIVYSNKLKPAKVSKLWIQLA